MFTLQNQHKSARISMNQRYVSIILIIILIFIAIGIFFGFSFYNEQRETKYLEDLAKNHPEGEKYLSEILEAKKKLKDKDNILDHMGSEELANNIFRAAQTSAKIERENITGQHAAGLAHHEVGKTIRKAIAELGGTMPEKLPTPEHIKESKKRIKTSLKKLK